MRNKAIPIPTSDVSFLTKVSYALGSTHLLPCIGTTSLTVIMALVAGQRASIFVLIPAVLFGQFTVGWLNDYLDRDRDRIAGRKDKPVAQGLISPNTILALIIPSFVLSIGLGFTFGVAAGWVYVVAMVSALLYDLYLKRTPLSILSLIVSFGLLPVFVALGSPIARWPHVWMIVACALLGATIHFLNVIPDFEDDKKTGVKGFVHYFSYNDALLIGALLLVVSVGSVLFGIYGEMQVLGWLLMGLFAAACVWFFILFTRRDIQKAFRVSNILTLLTVLVILSAARFM